MSDIISLWSAVIKIVFMAAPIWLPIVLWQKRQAINQYLFGQPTVKRIPTIVMSSDRIRDRPDPWFYADTGSRNQFPGGSGPENDIMSNSAPCSSSMDDAELLTLLSEIRAPNGTDYRFSANAIAEFLGGRRATILDQIKIVRGTPQFRLTEDQRQWRRDIGLEEK